MESHQFAPAQAGEEHRVEPSNQGQQKPAGFQDVSPQEPKARKPRVAVAVSAIAAVLIVVLGSVLFVGYQQAQEEKERLQREHEASHSVSLVSLVFDLPDYGEAEGTGVPISVRGSDLDGNEVSKKLVVKASGGQVELLRGNYTVSVEGMPANQAGGVYEANTQKVDVAIDGLGVSVGGQPVQPNAESNAQGEQSGSSQNASAVHLAFTPIPPDKLTDDQIDAIRQWMQDFGLQPEKTDEVVSAVTNARQAERERIAEAARQKAEEEARQQAEAERARAMAMLNGWWATEGEVRSVHYYFHDGQYEVYDDGRARNKPAQFIGAGTVQAMDRLSESQMAALGVNTLTGAGYAIDLSGVDSRGFRGGGYVLCDSRPDGMTYLGYPPDRYNYSAGSSLGRLDPPDSVLALIR